VVAIRQYPASDAARILQLFEDIQHQNIMKAKECYMTKSAMYIHTHDVPLTLDHVVWCGNIYPTHEQLSLILGQVRVISHPLPGINKKKDS
jgi:hypothetical protein